MTGPLFQEIAAYFSLPYCKVSLLALELPLQVFDTSHNKKAAPSIMAARFNAPTRDLLHSHFRFDLQHSPY